ncbi:MAG: hypothetical protein ACK55I_11050, partial [bacterium]
IGPAREQQPQRFLRRGHLDLSIIIGLETDRRRSALRSVDRGRLHALAKPKSRDSCRWLQPARAGLSHEHGKVERQHLRRLDEPHLESAAGERREQHRIVDGPDLALG